MTDYRNQRELILAAERAAKEAYAPYSGFRVGTAVAAADGTVFSGCNVENECSSLGMCAERGAISSMVAAGSRRVDTVAIFSPDGPEVLPCGACRQVLLEFACQEVVVLGGDAEVLRYSFPEELLPHAFKKPA